MSTVPISQVCEQGMHHQCQGHDTIGGCRCPDSAHARQAEIAEVRAAATTLRETASKATPGPWRRHDTWLDAGGHTATVLTDREDLNQMSLVAWLPTFSAEPWSDGRNAWNNAEWIALMSPDNAEPVAALLDFVAGFCELTASPVPAEALSFARSVNSTTGDPS